MNRTIRHTLVAFTAALLLAPLVALDAACAASASSITHQGPFVTTGDGGVLCVDAENALHSADEGRTWTATPVFRDAAKYRISNERALLRTETGWLYERKSGELWITTMQGGLRMRINVADCSLASGADEVSYHPRLEKLALSAPGRVALLNDGGLGCVAQGQYLLSIDDGKSWQARGKIPAGPGPAVSGGLLVQTRSGAMVLVYADNKGVRLERTKDNMPLPGAALHVWCVRSTDGGKTWGDHQRLIDGYCGAMIDAICTRDNKIIVPLQELRYGPPRHVTIVFTSADNGKTWNKSQDLDIGGCGLEDGAFEATVAQRRDDTLLAFLRTARDRIWSSESKDHGLTWTLPAPTDIRASNSPAFLLALASGRFALVWNQLYPEGTTDWPRRVKPRYAERPDNVHREELSLAFSNDEGKTWTNPVVIARQRGGRLGYAYMIERRPGEIWLALRGKWLKINEGLTAGRYFGSPIAVMSV